MDFLSLFVIVPTITVFAIAASKNYAQTRVIAAIGMSIQLILSIVLLFMYFAARKAGDTSEMLFAHSYTWFPSMNIKYAIGVDGIAVAMLVLTSVIVFAGIFASWTSVEKWQKEFFISLILLATGVFGFFISLDLFTMFLFYELAVIPMYLLIGIWGSGRKEYGAMKLTLMLMGGSALLLFGILGVYFNSYDNFGQHTFHIIEIAQHKLPLNVQLFFYPFIFVGFGVLGALFPLHTWSPDGHASAPTAVSMLHAGVLMKLGGYGILRVAMFLLPEAAQVTSWIFIILATIGVIYGAFGVIWQKDLKYINAYSSVSHVGLITFGLLMMNTASMDGAVIQMISHGLMTALFFALIGMIYGRTHTRDITQMGGLMKVIPFLAVCYVIGGLASLGLPGFSGFVAEMTIFVGAFQHADAFRTVATIIAASSIVVAAVYILRVVGILLFGPIKDAHFEHLTDATWYEKISTVTLIASITIIGMAPFWLSDMIQASLAPIVTRLSSVF
jgi:NADH-quinone oxidoreductase subunit M